MEQMQNASNQQFKFILNLVPLQKPTNERAG